MDPYTALQKHLWIEKKNLSVTDEKWTIITIYSLVIIYALVGGDKPHKLQKKEALDWDHLRS